MVPGPARNARWVPASTGAARDALAKRPSFPLTGFRRIGLEATARLRVRTPLRFGDLRVRKKAIRGVTSFLYDIHNNGKKENNNAIGYGDNDNSINNNYVIITINFIV